MAETIETVENPKYHPHAGWSDKDPKAPSILGDEKGIGDVEWTQEELDSLGEAFAGRADTNVIPELSEEEKKELRPAKKAKPAEAKQTAPEPEPSVEPEAEVEPETEAEATPEETSPEEVGSDQSADYVFKYKSGDTELELNPAQVNVLLRRAEESLITEHAALARAQEVEAKFNQLNNQLEQIRALVKAGNGNAILQLLGVPQATPETAPQVDFGSINWEDPAALQKAFQLQQQALTQSFETRLQKEQQQRQQLEQQQAEHAQARMLQDFAVAVDQESDQLAAQHPGFARLSKKQQESAARATRDAVARAYLAKRFNMNTPPDQIRALISKIADIEVTSWLAESRQYKGALIAQLQQKRETMPKGGTPKVTATRMPGQRKDPPKDFSAESLTDSIWSEFQARAGSQNIEGT